MRAIAAALSIVDRPVTGRALARELGLPSRAVTAIVNMLVAAGVAKLRKDGVIARDAIHPDRAVQLVDEVVDRRRRIDESRISMIRGFAETSRCRRAFLLEYFGVEVADPCGNCDTCDRGSAFEAEAKAGAADASETPGASGAAGEYRLDQAVRHREWGVGRVMSLEPDRVTVFFEDEGYRVLSLQLVREGELLEAI